MKQITIKKLLNNFSSALHLQEESESPLDFFRTYLQLISGASCAAIGAEATAKLFTEVRDKIPEKMKQVRSGQL